MNNILQDLLPSKLIIAIEDNLSSFLPVFGKLGESYIDNPVGIKRSLTNIPIALFNSVMGAQLETGQVDAIIQSIISDAGARRVPLLWWIGPSTRPTDLGRYLEKYAFTLDDQGPGMAVELAKMIAKRPEPVNSSIQLAQDDSALQQWCRTMAAGFEAPASADFAVKVWHSLLRHADPNTTLAYIGWLDGKPVATSLLFLAAGVAGIYAVATIPEARRKGMGALMTQTPLMEARARGYKIGVLQASEMGLGVYRSLGFQEYCEMVSYRWQPER
jgi:GNAT superfamily N-acetyltransferase